MREQARDLIGAALLLGAALSGCGPDVGEQRAAALTDGQAQLADDPSAALHAARHALKEWGEDPQAELLAATACLRLGERGEALAHAERGLAAEMGLSEDLAADLDWAKGTALFGRYRDLLDEDDWRAANVALERATTAGSHRTESCFLLIGLQDLGQHRDDERQLKFARLLFQLDPDGKLATSVRALLEQKGLQP